MIRSGAEFKLDETDAKALLFHAAKNGDSVTVRQLHYKNFDFNLTDDEGKTPLFYANRNCKMAVLCDLIRWNGEFKLDDINGKAVLFYAAKNDCIAVVTELHNKNFDLNITDDAGKTALSYANRNHSMDVLCELIVCGVEFKLDEIDGKAFLFYAASKNYKHVVKPLHNAGLTDERGKTVVFHGNEYFLAALIEVVEIFIDARDHCGRTPLFYALQYNDTRKARYLIEKGANIGLKDNCNVSIFTLFIETCTSKNVKKMNLFCSELFEEKQQRKALTYATLSHLYCQAPLLSFKSNASLY